MSEYVVSASRTMPVPADDVYRVIADFSGAHQRILPPAFSGFRVESGGVGAGTVMSYTIALGGRRRFIRSRADEPEPGRVLTETDLERGAVTTFTVDPSPDGCTVTISTRMESAGGLMGVVERFMSPRLLGNLYADELALLEKVASEPAGRPS